MRSSSFPMPLFEAQAGLTPATSDQTLKDVETKAGQDPAKIAACAATPAAKEAIEASRALGDKVGVNQTPTLFVNGRAPPVEREFPMRCCRRSSSSRRNWMVCPCPQHQLRLRLRLPNQLHRCASKIAR